MTIRILTVFPILLMCGCMVLPQTEQESQDFWNSVNVQNIQSHPNSDDVILRTIDSLEKADNIEEIKNILVGYLYEGLSDKHKRGKQQ